MTTRTERVLEQTLLWVVGVSLTGLISWATWSTAREINHEARISIVETKTDNIYKSLDRIEQGQRDLSKKIDGIKEQKHGS